VARGPEISRRLTAVVALFMLSAAISACDDGGGSGDRGTSVSTVPKVMQSEPNVTGVLELGGVNGARFRLVEVSDPYFDRGSIQIDPQDLVVSVSGEPIPADSLLGGMKVEVWVGGCTESNPVQCIAEAIRVVKP
jgi:hypothetical protein